MATIKPETIQQALSHVTDEASFLQELLIDTLDWPIDPSVTTVEEITYEWSQDELNAAGLDRKVADGTVRQLAMPGCPWGVFLLEFTNDDVFTKNRGMTGPLREVLRGLVGNMRNRPAHLPSFEKGNLLFICTHDYTQYRFGRFARPLEKNATPPLAIFGWDSQDSARTVCEHNLIHLTFLDGATKEEWLQHWAAAVDVEKVTKKFYEDYDTVFKKVELIIKAHTPLREDDLRLYTQSLFNRLMFIRFIERKGWLNLLPSPSGRGAGGEGSSNLPLPPGEGRGEGSPAQVGRNYLAALMNAGGLNNQSLYQSRLEPLFFEGLAVQGKQHTTAYGRVPFLNGGLFQRSELDEQIHDLPDEAFQPILGPKGLFYRFNFTIEESTPLEIEVAVDPEMLGKVFEELVTGRHESGSYYTPRQVVAFMCREALKGYLSEKVDAPEAVIAKLVDDNAIAQDSLSDAQAVKILKALEQVKAVDPACGSGAYLLGLLHEILAIRKTLQPRELREDPEFLRKRKLEIISRNLYGVDIDPFATNIAMLRLWLSLAVEATQPEPLPNLDFKIATGDALLGPNPQAMPELLIHHIHERADVLVALKDAFLRAHGNEKTELRRKIHQEESAIREALDSHHGEGVIDWRVQFAEAFRPFKLDSHTYDGRFGFAGEMAEQRTFITAEYELGGFDIVLANPPYIRQEQVKRMGIKPKLKETFPGVFTGVADLYVFFYARAVELLRDGGMLVFISSNKWFRAGYGKKLREYLAENTQTLSITDFGSLPVFKAVAYPMIYITQKSNDDAAPWHTKVQSLDPPYPDVRAVIDQQGERLAESAIDGKNWTLLNRDAAAVLEKMKENSTPLGEYVDGQIYYGIKTGFNKAFIIDGAKRAELIAEDARSAEIIKPLIQGKDIYRWRVASRDKWLIVTRLGIDIDRYPALLNHLQEWSSELESRYDKGEHWWELRSCKYLDAFERPKIIFPDIAKSCCFYSDMAGHHSTNTTYFFNNEDVLMLGVLNSSPVEMYYTAMSAQIRGDYLRFFRQYVEQIPIPTATESQRSTIGGLAQKCLDAKAADPAADVTDWEREIDEHVAGLYGIDLSDIAE